jgi:hypothetical protein
MRPAATPARKAEIQPITSQTSDRWGSARNRIATASKKSPILPALLFS